MWLQSNTNEITPNGANASLNWCDSMSGLMSPTNTWKCSAQIKTKVCKICYIS